MSFIQTIFQVINNNKDLIIALSSFGTCIIALIALNTWKKQLYAKASNKIARNILRYIYVIQNDIALIRSPYRTYGETIIAEQEIDRGNELLGRIGQLEASFYNVRTKNMRKACSNLYAILPEAEILWGKDVHYTVEPLFKLTKELYKNINGWIFQKSFPESKVEYNPKIVFSSFSEDDEFGIEVENAIQRIKDYIKEKIIY